MAQSDWDLIRGTGTVATLNSGLTNPLPVGVGSSFCRFFNAANGGPVLRNNRPEFTNMPPTKALSATMCMRRQAGFATGNWAGFRLKGVSTTFTTSNNGYGIAFKSGAASTTEGSPVLKVNNADNLELIGIPSSSFYDSNWIRLRLDVFPMGLGGDRLIVYRETVIGSGVWDAVQISGSVSAADGIVLLPSSPRYAPWNTGSVYIESTNFSGNSYYFDTFTLSATTVP